VFGELVALTLYRRYVEEGSDFLPQYVALLEAGGSQSPADLLAPMGLDITDPSVWNRGFLAIEELIIELEALGRREEGTR
jgi:oligoendopeptidase F